MCFLSKNNVKLLKQFFHFFALCGDVEVKFISADWTEWIIQVWYNDHFDFAFFDVVEVNVLMIVKSDVNVGLFFVVEGVEVELNGIEDVTG